MMLNFGYALAVVMNTAGGPSAALRAYLQFPQADEADMGNILSSFAAAGSDSDDQSEPTASSSSVAPPTSSAR